MQRIFSTLGVLSKVAVPLKSSQEVDSVIEETIKEVPSVIKVKPRVIPPNTQQANKNLLLKAVAEAQKSIAQTPSVGNNTKVSIRGLFKKIRGLFELCGADWLRENPLGVARLADQLIKTPFSGRGYLHLLISFK